MPISIDLLRPDSDGGTVEQLLESQCLRYPDISEHDLRSQLQDLQTHDIARRTQVKILEQERNTLKILQRSLAPASAAATQVDKDEVNKQIKHLKETIQIRQDKLRVDIAMVRENLTRIGNLVDTQLDCGELKTPRSESNLVGINHGVNDPVFCLGGYERIQVEGSATFTVVSGHMVELAQALSMHAISWFKKEQFLVMSLPDSLCLEPTLTRSLMGCNQRTGTEERVTPFLADIVMHQDRKFWDRELPLRHVCLTSIEGGTAFSSKRKWFREVKSQQIGIVGMTGCTLGESRILQKEFVDRIVEFYSSLLITTCPGYKLQGERQMPMVRTRQVTPSQLEPSEASRIIVEGYLHGDYVILASVSNHTDFMTREMKIRCGGAHVDYVHSVQGTCCTIYETLEFLVQHNVLLQEESGTLGVGIPSHLATLMGYTSTMFLPFQRSLQMGKGGRKPVVNELPFFAPCAIDETTIAKCDAVKKTRAPFALNRLPNRDEVRAERLMSPFEFLPLE